MSKPLGLNYWKLWFSSAISNFGDGIAIVAYPWLASAITRDPFQIALVATLQRLPWLLCTLPAGVITDRVDRRQLVAWMDISRFVVTLGVAIVVFFVQDQLSSPKEIASNLNGIPTHSFLLLMMIYVATFLLGIALRD